MTKETRNALLSSLLLQLESACDTLRAVIADELDVTAPLGAGVNVGASGSCPHAPDLRRNLTTMGGGPLREMCRACGQMFENGKPIEAPASEAS